MYVVFKGADKQRKGANIMTALKVADMHCEKCVERITKAMTADGLDFAVSLEDKMVTINGCEQCVKTAIATLDDLGFEAVVA